MLSQYVFPSKHGLFRIIKHGRRWRTLLGESETGRHESAESAIEALRSTWPQARLPHDLAQWRYLPQLALVHARASNELVIHWRLAG